MLIQFSRAGAPCTEANTGPFFTQMEPLVSAYRFETTHLATALAACRTAKIWRQVQNTTSGGNLLKNPCQTNWNSELVYTTVTNIVSSIGATEKHLLCILA